MKPEDVRSLYDSAYAASYEAKFLTSTANAPDTEFELELLGKLLTPQTQWLDVACGTGYFLRQFSGLRRTGADLSPAMLEKAVQGAPGVDFFEHDFRNPRPEWVGRFGLVSCMWYAYTYVDTMDEVAQVVSNLASWTSPTGVCLAPLADARLISRSSELPYELPYAPGGRLVVSGILWSFIEDDVGKVHAHMVVPQVEFMVEQFERFFRTVRVVRYPHKPDGVHGRPALIASDKR